MLHQVPVGTENEFHEVLEICLVRDCGEKFSDDPIDENLNFVAKSDDICAAVQARLRLGPWLLCFIYLSTI